MVYVLTVDQRASRSSAADLVPRVLVALNRRTRDAGLLRRFERTAGDEVQGVLATPDAVVTSIAVLLREARWSIGLGIGAVDHPLPRTTRAGSGPAFVAAREAVTRAKSGPHHVAAVGADPYRAEQVETVLWLWAALLSRRSPRGWEVSDLLAEGLSHQEAADRLGITQSAVSQRARVAGVTEEGRARRLAEQLLAEADAAGSEAAEGRR